MMMHGGGGGGGGGAHSDSFSISNFHVLILFLGERGSSWGGGSFTPNVLNSLDIIQKTRKASGLIAHFQGRIYLGGTGVDTQVGVVNGGWGVGWTVDLTLRKGIPTGDLQPP